MNIVAASQRDWVGYGSNPPDPKWPGGARLALNFVMNYEEGRFRVQLTIIPGVPP